jgi:hypothetical protein
LFANLLPAAYRMDLPSFTFRPVPILQEPNEAESNVGIDAWVAVV